MLRTDLSVNKDNSFLQRKNQNENQLIFVCSKDRQGKLACRWIKGCPI